MIEILVVLVVMALITGTLLSAYERILDVRIRLVTFTDSVGTPDLVSSWFRDSVDGLIADSKNGPNKFAGGRRRLSGLSLATPTGTPGVPTRILWELGFDPAEDRTSLRFQAGDGPQLAVASWPGDRGGFRYCQPDLQCYESWPPPQGTAEQLPAVIRLDLVKGSDAWPILAAPRDARDPPLARSS
ncbi:MAG: hypothetical protein P4L83_04470 [Nevskia sp.]|nr:hypothetical protein [Nevskia sp.]